LKYYNYIGSKNIQKNYIFVYVIVNVKKFKEKKKLMKLRPVKLRKLNRKIYRNVFDGAK